MIRKEDITHHLETARRSLEDVQKIVETGEYEDIFEEFTGEKDSMESVIENKLDFAARNIGFAKKCIQ